MRIWNSTKLGPGVRALNMEESHLVCILRRFCVFSEHSKGAVEGTMIASRPRFSLQMEELVRARQIRH